MILAAAAFLSICVSAGAGQDDNACAAGEGTGAGTTPPPRLKLHQDWQEKDVAAAEGQEEAPSEYRWCAMLCMANAYPGLKSEDLIHGLFDPIMHAIAPGIDRINTFGDMRDDYLLWVPNLGVGYNLSPHFSLFLQLGYGAGPVRTEDSANSILFLPLHLSFEMKRSAFTITPGLDYFPFGMVQQRDYHGLMERLRAIRPMLGVRVPWTHAGYTAHAKIGLWPVEKLLRIDLGDSWDVWSTNVNVGVDVPITRRNQVNINYGHSFFYGHDSDFGGPVFSVTWKYSF